MGEVAPAPFELHWRMFGTPVRVHPLFWALAAYLGWHYFEVGGFRLLALWVACVFVSILLHEMGHVVVGRYFGAEGSILLYWFGGLAIGSSDLPKRGQRIAVFLAGPFAELLLGGAVWVALRFVADLPLQTEFGRYGLVALLMLLEINLFWAVFNLLPVWPLDGGRVTAELCEAAAPGRGLVAALWASMVFCGAVAVYILLSAKGVVRPLPYLGSQPYNAIMFGVLSLNNFQTLQAERMRRGWDDRLPWER